MKRGAILAVAALIVATLGVVPAQAHKAADNSWTQMQNGNYPATTSDANCYPCVRWPYDHSGTWHTFGYAHTGAFYTDAVSAIKEWSGQNYRSPFFYEGSPAPQCPSYDLCVDGEALSRSACGIAHVYNNAQWYIPYATAAWNTVRTYVDGPVTSTSPYCDLRHAFHHEVGHTFSEGHSSRSVALMWAYSYAGEHVDTFSQQELSAVYGTLAARDYGCPCPSIATIKAKLLAEAESLDSIPTDSTTALDPPPAG